MEFLAGTAPVRRPERAGCGPDPVEAAQAPGGGMLSAVSHSIVLVWAVNHGKVCSDDPARCPDRQGSRPRDNSAIVRVANRRRGQYTSLVRIADGPGNLWNIRHIRQRSGAS